MLGQNQSNSTFATAALIVQHILSRILESEKMNRTAYIKPLLLWCVFLVRAIPPCFRTLGCSSSKVEAGMLAAARCDTASGHNVIWSQKNKMLDAGSITHEITASECSSPTFRSSTSLPWQANIFKSEPHKRVAYTNSRTAKKKVRSMKFLLSSATTNSTTLMPEDSATENRSAKKRIPEIQKSEGWKEGKTDIKTFLQCGLS